MGGVSLLFYEVGGTVLGPTYTFRHAVAGFPRSQVGFRP